MSDYGIFGKGSSGDSWFANRVDDFHESTKKWDPVSHYSVELPMKGAHWLVEKGAGGAADAGIAPDFMNRLSDEADENGSNFGLGSQRMGLGIGSVLGGMYAYGAAAGGGGGSGTAASGLGAGDGAFLGEGVASGVGSWDGAAGGMGLGFNPDAGLGTVNGDFAGTQGSGSPWSKMMSQMGGQMKSSGQQQQAAGAQRSDALQQQIMADLLRQEAQTRSENSAWQANQRFGGFK